MRRIGVVLAATVLVAATGCGSASAEPAPGLFESQGVIDWEPVATLAELAARSDVVALGALVGVEEGYVFGSAVDDEFGTPYLELIVDTGDGDPLRLLWSYAPGYTLDEIREALPMEARMVVYANEFEVAASDRESFHHIGEADHDHYRWSNPQGLIVEDPDTGELMTFDPSVVFDDAPLDDADLSEWVVAPLAFDDPQLAGQCEVMTATFETDAPSPATTEVEAAELLVADNSILDGLDVADGVIMLRGEQVGTYEVVDRPGGTFAVAEAEWCYAEP